jgi:enamine deaminase RidA (YjgF/YER057c/UK114 family)
VKSIVPFKMHIAKAVWVHEPVKPLRHALRDFACVIGLNVYSSAAAKFINAGSQTFMAWVAQTLVLSIAARSVLQQAREPNYSF